MTFSGHTAVSLLILNNLPDPGAVVMANIAVHPILDAIPHAEWTTFQDSKWKAGLITAIDFLVGIGLIWLALEYSIATVGLIVLSILVGLWLDWLDLFLGRWWKGLRKMHQYFHTWPEKPIDPVDWSKTVTGRTPTWIKVATQILLVIVSIALIA